jgi:hypothetical protein
MNFLKSMGMLREMAKRKREEDDLPSAGLPGKFRKISASPPPNEPSAGNQDRRAPLRPSHTSISKTSSDSSDTAILGSCKSEKSSSRPKARV